MEADPAPLGYRNDQSISLVSWDGNPNSDALDALFDELEKRTGKQPIANRRTIREIEHRWRLAGQPNFVGERLESGVPSEATLVRVFASAISTVVDEPSRSANHDPSLTPSARVWKELSSSPSLADLDHFLAAFPNAPEANVCRAVRAELSTKFALEYEQAARQAEFDLLPSDGFDPRPFEIFIAKHTGTIEAFHAARMATEVRARALKHRPDDDTRRRWEISAAVNILLGKAIPAEQAPYLKNLTLSAKDQTLYAALEAADSSHYGVYESAHASVGNRRLVVSDLRPVSGLTGMASLDLWGTQIDDLSPLKELSELTTLDLMHTPVFDLKPLAGLKKLAWLNLRRTKVQDLESIEHVPHIILPDGNSRKGRRAS